MTPRAVDYVFRRMNKKELSERDICTKFITPASGAPAGTS